MKEKYGLPLVFILIFALTRVPGLMPWNFSAAYALAFCAGVYFPRRMAWWLPLTTLLVTDVLLNVFWYHVPPLNGYMVLSLAGFAGIVAIGRCFKPQMNWFLLVGGGLLGSILFYLVSNTASWIYDPGYARTLAGWLQALTVGRPDFHPTTLEFFRNTLLSGGLFTALFAGAMKLTAAAESAKEKEAVEEEGEKPEEAKA